MPRLVATVALTMALLSSASLPALAARAAAAKTAAGASATPALPVAPANHAIPASDVLKKADEIRSPSSSYLMEVSVETPGESEYRYEIAIGGKDASLIRTLKPEREVGKNFLMLNEDMWAFIPNIKRSIRVTLNQKLTGQASNGDISRMRWFGDYDPVIESENADHWVLLLTAKRRALTYDKIRVWITKSNFRPAKGEYLTAQGKILKYINFDEFGEIAGALRPTKMTITNATKRDESSILRILAMKELTFPANHFTQNNLQ